MPSDGTDSQHVLVQHLMHVMEHDAVLLKPKYHTAELAVADTEAAAGPEGSSAQAHDRPAACSKQQPSGQHSGPVQHVPAAFSTFQEIHGLPDPAYQDAAHSHRLNAAPVPSSKLCYTVTTWAPGSLQQLQMKSRAICEAAAAGAIAAAATIPRGPALLQHHHSMHVDPSTRVPAHWLAEPGVGSHAPHAIHPVLAFSAVPADQQADSMTALQDSSAQLLQQMQSDDIKQQLHIKALQRQAIIDAIEQQAAMDGCEQSHPGAVAPALKRQQELHEAASPQGMASPEKRRCFDTHSGTFNNLSIQCSRRPNDHDNEAYHPSPAAASPCSMDSACTPMHAGRTFGYPAASPYTPTTCNNSGEQGLSPVFSQQLYPEPVITASAAALSQPPTPACQPLDTTTPGAATYQATWDGIRRASVARSAASPTVRQNSHLQSCTSGVDTLLKPSEREAAAAEALTGAAYAAAHAAAAMTGGSPNTTSRIAKQLAAAAVHAVKQDLTAACAGQDMVPQVSPYTVLPSPADPSTPLPTLGYAAAPAFQTTPFTDHCVEQPHPLSGCRKPLFTQQQGPAQLDTPLGCGAAWDSTGSALAAEAGYAGSSWTAGGMCGHAHPDWEAWAASGYAAFPQPGGLQGAHFQEQLHYAQCAEGYAFPFSGYYQQPAGYEAYAYGYYPQQDQQVDDQYPACPGSPGPQLAGVDYWSDQRTVLCISNALECPQAFHAEARGSEA